MSPSRSCGCRSPGYNANRIEPADRVPRAQTGSRKRNGRHKGILILGGVAYVFRRDSLEEKSGLAMREFLEWLDDNMR